MRYDKMEKKYVLALDEGTTSVRAILFDKQANVISCAQHEFTQIYPHPGWVEHDPMEIYANQYAAMTECIAKTGISPEEIAAVGITNQRETTVVWEKATGRPVYNAIVWQCRRTAKLCEKIISDGMEDYIREASIRQYRHMAPMEAYKRTGTYYRQDKRLTHHAL